MFYLVGVANFSTIVFIVLVWHKKLHDSPIIPFFFPALLYKLSAGALLGLIYYYHYNTGDTFLYFHDAALLADEAYKSPLSYLKIIFGESLEHLKYKDDPRALLIVKMLSLPAIVTFKNYWISGFYFSLLSFYGMWKLAELISRLYPTCKIYAVVAFLFYPSVVFWSSGVLKEPVIMTCISLCVVIYLPYLSNHGKTNSKKILISILLLLILWKLKFYYAAVFIPILLVGISITYLRSKSAIIEEKFYLQCLLSLLLLIVFYFPISYLHPLLKIQNVLIEVVRNHDWYLINGSLPAEGYIHFKGLSPEILPFIKNFPLALFSGLFRPLIFDANNVFQFLVGLENLILFILFIGLLLNIARLSYHRNPSLIMILCFYIIVLATVLAFVAPNFGSLMRYKIAFLPFFVFLTIVDNPFVRYIKGKLGH